MRTTITAALSAILGTAFLSGSPAAAENPPESKRPADTPVDPEEKLVPVEKSLDPDLAAVVAGNNRFALEMFRRSAARPGNRFSAPISVSTAMSLVYSGAAGDTAAQMRKALSLPEDRRQFDAGLAALVRKLDAAATGRFKLTVSNALWGQSGHEFRPEFVASARLRFLSTFEPADFRADPEAARKRINSWAEEKTEKRVREILPPGSLSEARLVLTNAVHFKANWMNRFDPRDTQPGEFAAAPDRKIQVPMMSTMGNFGHAETTGLRALEMPYSGREASMLVFVPETPEMMAALEHGLTPEYLDACVKALESRTLAVHFPKFRFEDGAELSDILSAMGMPAAFSPAAADFSGITGKRDLYVSKVFHKTFVAVDENGTEAAGATAVVAKPRGIALEPIIFRADRPFLMVIRDNRTGSILFVGRVAEPRGGE